ncbi:glycoside hydrolase family 88 protein [Sunxiuqinia indica]|uniref:glycoside hydrolase family 88 protein n=1 Tax=Sunxiuqinia indica TaxID=2692584 RepID=UPI00135CA2F0|nr:glycoside hydrolase family 88 protein [Sunxiuqinia indica]
MNNLFYTIIVLICLSACSSNSREKLEFDEQQMLDYTVEKVIASLSSMSCGDSLPRNIYSGQTDWNLVGINDWCSGFWPGILWYAYEESKNPDILASAQGFTEPLGGVLEVPVDNHDLGFMLYSSYGNGFRLTGNPAYQDVILTSADSLATLYNSKVGTILSWPSMREKMNWPHNTIIDNMINLELLFWASKNGGSQHLYDIAVKHAETCMTTLIRPDYSTYHVAVFDTIDGHFIKGVTHQGYADNSMWARGQSWGIYGYTMAYRETGDERFLDLATKLADRFLERLPEDGIPYWDFDDPKIPDAPKDASAACVAASALLELSSFMDNENLKAGYKNAAIKMLSILSTDAYLANGKNQAFLMHSTGHYPNGSEIDASIIYADYYYIEALTRLKKINAGKRLH